MEVDDGGRWNIVNHTYNGNTLSHFTNKLWENLFEVCISPDDALIVRNIYIEILPVFICETWTSIPVVSVIYFIVFSTSYPSYKIHFFIFLPLLDIIHGK